MRFIRHCFQPESRHRVLFTASHGGGAWNIRGEDIASTRRNWKAKREISTAEISEYDIVVVVKHGDQKLFDAVRSAGKKVVFDVIDGWLQPEEGLANTNLAMALELFRKKWQSLAADAFVFPTAQMEADLRCLTPLATHIYHHFWPKFKPVVVRKKVKRIGYQGDDRFLGSWREIMMEICSKRGIEFCVNPRFVRSMDIMFAARGGEHDSFLANRYKSNVKLANCFAMGLPCLAGQKEAAYHETDNGYVSFFSDSKELAEKVDYLLDYDVRTRIHNEFVMSSQQYSLKSISLIYEEFFDKVMAKTP